MLHKRNIVFARQSENDSHIFILYFSFYHEGGSSKVFSFLGLPLMQTHKKILRGYFSKGNVGRTLTIFEKKADDLPNIVALIISSMVFFYFHHVLDDIIEKQSNQKHLISK